jgi:uncharacterized protein
VAIRPLNFTLKTVSRCNLNCAYCYVYNKADTSWRARPTVMTDEVFDATVRRIEAHCSASGQARVQIAFHGGEPCLAGPQRFAGWCRQLSERLDPFVRLELQMQTNGTLIDDDWVRVLRAYDVRVGVSIDGPPEVHDANRVDHAGRGSHAQVERGIERLRAGGVSHGVICVISFDADGLAVHRYLTGLGISDISYLMPDFSHDTIAPVRERYGETPCADFLLPILDAWWNTNALSVRVEPFRTIARTILGGHSAIDLFGNRPFGYVFIEADGAIEGLDVLRVCHDGCATTGLNVLRDDPADITNVDSLHRRAIFHGLALPTPCGGCREERTCAGGYLPHRYGRDGGFDHASVWCADILKIFGRLRTHMLENDMVAS